MPGHSFTFNALLLRLRTTKPGDSFDLDFHIDADDMPTLSGRLPLSIPKNPDELLFSRTGSEP
jgi:hypothetical protein